MASNNSTEGAGDGEDAGEEVKAATSIISASFSSFDDFSSRMILLPKDDDECTGAMVGSHEVPENISAPTSGDGEVNGGAGYDDDNSCSEEAEPRSNSEETECTSSVHVGIDQNPTMQVPEGYILVKIRSNGDIPEDLESIDFAELLSIMREASYPLSMEFSPPVDTPGTSHSSKGSFFSENDDAESKDGTASQTNSSSGPLEVGESLSEDDVSDNQLATLVSREEAAKYAKQAATELRGRLSRWGHVAAIRAADAASQVKELRDERQRRMKEDQQHREDQNESNQHEDGSEETADDSKEPAVIEETKQQDLVADADPKPIDHNSVEGKDAAPEPPPEPSPPMEQCFLFLQTRSGFEQLPDNGQGETSAFPTITNSSVISVRLSKESACPLGRNGFTFQWFRSNNDSDDTEEIKTWPKDGIGNSSTLGWSLLPGACYAAYQPSACDVGHRLRCIINQGGHTVTCHLPCLIAMEHSLFESAITTLIGGNNSVKFGNLRGLDDLSMYRLKIDVESNDDFISGSSIFIEKATGGSVDEMDNQMDPVPHFKVEADPSKPRLFDLICSSHGRLRLQAANRKSRESLILALGIANFKGKLSSLTNKTALFCSDETEDTSYSDVPSEQPDIPPADGPNDSHSRQLEAKIAEMHRLLKSKDVAITKLQNELVSSDANKLKVERELESCRVSEQELKDTLQKSEVEVKEKARTIEELLKAQSNAEMVQERTVKALNNEKAVLQAAIEARDGKIEVLSNQISASEERATMLSEQLSSIDQLRNELAQTQEKFTSAEKVAIKMKKTEIELQQDLKSAKGIVLDLNDKFLAAKEAASKRESECRKLKMERNSLKNRADGLSKEMSRMSKNKAEALELEKLKLVMQELRNENSNLQEQIQMVTSEKRHALEALEATSLAHQQSVTHQMTTDGNSDGCTSSEQRISELESVISSMTEYLNAKEMQIETLKQVNQALSMEINELTKS